MKPRKHGNLRRNTGTSVTFCMCSISKESYSLWQRVKVNVNLEKQYLQSTHFNWFLIYAKFMNYFECKNRMSHCYKGQRSLEVRRGWTVETHSQYIKNWNWSHSWLWFVFWATLQALKKDFGTFPIFVGMYNNVGTAFSAETWSSEHYVREMCTTDSFTAIKC